jgi:hypothetical protein
MKLRSITVLAAILVALAGIYLVTNRTQIPIEAERLPFVWQFAPDTLTRVSVSLVREGEAETWVRRGGNDWVFEATGEAVDEVRWGLGIPLLLSGPRAARIVGDVESSRLDAYGLAAPRVTIGLDLADGRKVTVHVGDTTPDGAEDYLTVEGSPVLYSVSREWAGVVERLVHQPPVAPLP